MKRCVFYSPPQKVPTVLDFKLCLEKFFSPNLVETVFLLFFSLIQLTIQEQIFPSGRWKSNHFGSPSYFTTYSIPRSNQEITTLLRIAQSPPFNKQDFRVPKSPSIVTAPRHRSHPPRSVKGVSVGFEVRFHFQFGLGQFRVAPIN